MTVFGLEVPGSLSEYTSDRLLRLACQNIRTYYKPTLQMFPSDFDVHSHLFLHVL